MDLSMFYKEEMEVQLHGVPKDTFEAWAKLGSDIRELESSRKFRCCDIQIGGLTIALFSEEARDDN